MGTFTKTMILGRVGNDPVIETLPSTGDLVAKFSVATGDKWTDKATGEKRERTEWHNCVVRDQGLIENVVQPYVKKGGQVHIVGENETRSWDKDGDKHYRTEVVLRPYRGDSITLADTAPPALKDARATGQPRQQAQSRANGPR